MVRAALAMVSFAVVAAMSCGYRPAFRDCEVLCSPATGCPAGFECGGEGYCRPSGDGASCGALLEDAGVDGRAEVLRIRATPNLDLDLLFLIDDSPTMLGQQATLKSALPALFAALTSPQGEPLNLHIGVVSSDLGTQGSAVAMPGPGIGVAGLGGCSGVGKAGALQTGTASLAGVYLSDIAGPGGQRIRNFTAGSLVNAVAAMVSLGEDGCGFEQQLAAVRTALSSHPSNTGFLRPGAGLAVVIVSDEDDCSILDPAVLTTATATFGPLQSFRCFQFGAVCDPDAPTSLGPKQGCKPRATSPYLEDIAPFRNFLAGLKPDPRDVMLGVLAGPPSPIAVELRASGMIEIPAVARVCSYLDSSGLQAAADPGIRFGALVDSFPGRAHFEPLCAANLSPALGRIGQAARQLVGGTCLEGEIADTSSAAGIQADCVVTDVSLNSQSIVQPCSLGGSPCWELFDDAAQCSALQHLRLAVTRASPPPATTRTVVRCQVP
jgi:hypothetical protein